MLSWLLRVSPVQTLPMQRVGWHLWPRNWKLFGLQGTLHGTPLWKARDQIVKLRGLSKVNEFLELRSFSVLGVRMVMLVTLSQGSHVSHAYVQMRMEVGVSLPFPAIRIHTLELHTVNVCLDIQVLVHYFLHRPSKSLPVTSLMQHTVRDVKIQYT